MYMFPKLSIRLFYMKIVYETPLFGNAVGVIGYKVLCCYQKFCGASGWLTWLSF